MQLFRMHRCFADCIVAGGTLFTWGLMEWRLARNKGDNSIPEVAMPDAKVSGRVVVVGGVGVGERVARFGISTPQHCRLGSSSTVCGTECMQH